MKLETTARLCGSCPANMVELLSDEAGIIFGCPICRRLDAGPPAIVERRMLSRWERRRTARSRLRGRQGRRRGVRVSRVQEQRRPRPDGLVVLRREHLQQVRGKERTDLGDGWVLGLLVHPNDWRGPLLVRSAPRAEPPGPTETAEWSTPITETTIKLKPAGGFAWGHFDETAPAEVVKRAFHQLGYERWRRARDAFAAGRSDLDAALI